MLALCVFSQTPKNDNNNRDDDNNIEQWAYINAQKVIERREKIEWESKIKIVKQKNL